MDNYSRHLNHKMDNYSRHSPTSSSAAWEGPASYTGFQQSSPSRPRATRLDRRASTGWGGLVRTDGRPLTWVLCAGDSATVSRGSRAVMLPIYAKCRTGQQRVAVRAWVLITSDCLSGLKVVESTVCLPGGPGA
eukprot:5597875-Pleurochrysis_carterae.AAC.4